MAATSNSTSLPSGPLRLASSSKPSHTFALRYPASHPSDLSTAGASLSSTASGDVSLRMAPGAHPSENRGRRWAGRQTRATGDVECAIVWDPVQHSWILHRVDNVVQLASDDPEPLPKKPTPSIQPPPKHAPLALPKPARPQAPLPSIPIESLPPKPKPISPPSVPPPSAPCDPPSSTSRPPPKSNHPPRSKHLPDPSPRPRPSHPLSRHNSIDSSSPVSPVDPTSQLARPPPSTDTHPLANNSTSRPGLALPPKKPLSSVQPSQTTVTRVTNRANTSAISSPGEQGPIRVVQAEEVEEFDFIDSPPDPIPHQPIIAPSPLTLPSPVPAHVSASVRSGASRPATIHTINHSPNGRPTLSRSPSLADGNGASAGSPLARSSGNSGLTLPTRSSAARPTAPSPAYHHNGLAPRSAAIANQPTAPSPLHSLAYSSESSPTDPIAAAPTPLIVSASPASVTATTAGSGGIGQPRSTSSTAPLRAPVSQVQNGRSPAPAWQYTHHLHQPSNPSSPHGVRSPAPLTNQNLGLVNNQSQPVPMRTYQRSDSGSSVRESDTDSEDDDEDQEESSEEEFESVPAPTTQVPTQVNAIAANNSEDDAEADDDDDEDEEFDLQNFATELEASMLIGAYYGPGTAAYNGTQPPVQEEPVLPSTPAAKGKPKKKAAAPKATGGGTTRRASASGKGKGKGKGAATKG